MKFIEEMGKKWGDFESNNPTSATIVRGIGTMAIIFVAGYLNGFGTAKGQQHAGGKNA